MQDNIVEGKNSTEWNTESEHIHCDCEILQFIKWIGERHVQKRRQQRINCKYLEYLCSEREREEESEGVECENAPRMLYYALHAFSLSLSLSLARSFPPYKSRSYKFIRIFPFYVLFCFVSYRV